MPKNILLPMFLLSFAISVTAFANVSFKLNNNTNQKLLLFTKINNSGGLHLPVELDPKTQNNHGIATTSDKKNQGIYSYGLNYDNRCLIEYSQTCGLSGCKYRTHIEKSIGNVSCKVSTDSDHSSIKIIDLYVS